MEKASYNVTIYHFTVLISVPIARLQKDRCMIHELKVVMNFNVSEYENTYCSEVFV